MKEMIRQGIENVGINLKPSAVILFMILIFCVTTLIIFRQQCVSQGYEISRLSTVLESKSMAYEKVSDDYSAVLRREMLINKAGEMGFVFPVGGKVFYVR